MHRENEASDGPTKRVRRLHWVVWLLLALMGVIWFGTDAPGREGFQGILILAFPVWVWQLLKEGAIRVVGPVLLGVFLVSWLSLIGQLIVSVNQAIPSGVYLGFPVFITEGESEVNHVIARVERGPLDSEMYFQIFHNRSNDWFEDIGYEYSAGATRWISLPWDDSQGIKGRVAVRHTRFEESDVGLLKSPAYIEKNLTRLRAEDDQMREALRRGEYSAITDQMERSMKELNDFANDKSGVRVSWFVVRDFRSDHASGGSYLLDFAWCSMSWDEYEEHGVVPDWATAKEMGLMKFEAIMVLCKPESWLSPTLGADERDRFRRLKDAGWPSDL